ncbi:MAG: sulfoxide reductase heme-binding subunit YedZ, partial [Acidobacteria bacterium]|nr:sulfoxide reductase heme-binding subunit YedZ [Acidobacteriota bacterium]
LIPLALTSTRKWIVRLGGKRWQWLHRLIYVTGGAGVIHYFWLVKSDIQRPAAYGALLAVLLGVRAWYAFRGRRSAAAIPSAGDPARGC